MYTAEGEGKTKDKLMNMQKETLQKEMKLERKERKQDQNQIGALQNDLLNKDSEINTWRSDFNAEKSDKEN